MYRWLVIPIFVIACVAISSIPQYAFSADKQTVDNELTTFIQQLFANRAKYLLRQEDGLLRDFYMPERASSMRAMKHEQMRAQYVQTWVKHRQLRLADAASSPRVIRAHKRNDQVFVSAVDSLRLGYTYNQPSSQVELFGIGTRHALTLIRKNGSWKVLREWYLDPLEENPDLIPKLTELPRNSASNRVNAKTNQLSGLHSTSTRYNRDKAIDYANKYAGIAWGAGNNHRYNMGDKPIMTHIVFRTNTYVVVYTIPANLMIIIGIHKCLLVNISHLSISLSANPHIAHGYSPISIESIPFSTVTNSCAQI